MPTRSRHRSTSAGSRYLEAAALAFAAAFVFAAALALTVVPAAAQRPIESGRAVDPDAYIRIWNGAGSLRVEGWDADSIAVTGQAEPGRFYMAAREDVAKLGLEGDLDAARGDLFVRVPRGATLWIRTTSSDIAVRGVTGSLDLYSVTGAIEVEGAPAHFYAESMGGDLTLRIESAVARARTGAGGIAFEGAVEDLTLETVEGAITVATAGVRRARLTTVEGGIRFTGDVRSAGSLELETHSGDILLLMPPGIRADFDLSTFEGRIRNDLGTGPAQPARGQGRSMLTFGTGAGEAEVVVRSFSGSIDVRARPPR